MEFLKELPSEIAYELRGKRLWTLLGIFIIVIGLAITVTFSKQQQTIQQHAASATNPPDGYGIYESCGVSTGCYTRLDTMAQAGFKEVLDYSIWDRNPTIQQFIDYANHANTVGIKVIWNFKDFWKNTHQYIQDFPAMAATCNCSDNAGFIRYVVTSVKDLPGTWGYYIADEAFNNSHAQVKAIADIIHTTDPNHPRLYVGAAWSTGNVASILGTYADTAEVLATDYYPVGYGQDINYTGSLASAVQQVANNTGKSSAMVLQAHSWNHYPNGGYAPPCLSRPYPTLSDMMNQLNQTLRSANPRIIIYYSYFDIAAQICPEDNYTLHWNNLVSTIQSYNPLPDPPANTACVGQSLYDTKLSRDFDVDYANGSYIRPVLYSDPGHSQTQSCIQTWCTNNTLYAKFSWNPGYNLNASWSHFDFEYRLPDGTDQTFLFPSGTTSKTIKFDAKYAGQTGWARAGDGYDEYGYPHTKFVFASCTQPTATPIPTKIPSPTQQPTETPIPTQPSKKPSLSPTPTVPAQSLSCTKPLCPQNLPSGCYLQGQTACSCGVVTCPSSVSLTNPTIVPNDTYLTFHIALTGVTNPLHTYRTFSFTLLDTNNHIVQEKSDILTYDKTNNEFTATVDLGQTIQPFSTIQIRVPQFATYIARLAKQPMVQQVNILPPISLSPGDINNDGSITVLDYNIIQSCFQGIKGSCTQDMYHASDLNDDGIVDGIDYNLLIRSLVTQ